MGKASRILAVTVCVAGCLPDTSDFSSADAGRSDGSAADAAVDGGQDMFVAQSCRGDTDCVSPRNDCQLAEGSCEGGECVYETRIGETCDDESPCTTSDRCRPAGCLGDPLVCTPPEPRCEANVLITASGGRCEAGSCVFDESRETCPMGCAGGACEVDVCVPMDWTLTDVGAASTLDFAASVDHRTDASGTDHVVYVADDGLHYLSRPRGGSWTDAVVEGASAGAPPKDPSLGFDDGGVPHIAFARWNDEVVHAFRAGPGWDTESIATRGGTPAITGTTDGALHVVYENSGLRHAVRASGATEWVTEPIRRSDGGVTRAANADAIVLLSDGLLLHLVFTDFGEDVLAYGRFTDTWALETVWDALVLPSAFDAALGAGGAVHVSFSDDAEDALRYAHRPAGAGSWDVQTVHDEVNRLGDPNAIAVTGAGAIHIAYRDEIRFDLRYAWRPAGGTFEHAALDPDNGFAAGAYADDAGRVRFVYRAVPPVGPDVLRVAEVRDCP